MNKRVYTYVDNRIIAAGVGPVLQVFNLTDVSKEIKIKSIFWGLAIYQNVAIPAPRLNLYTQNTQTFALSIGLAALPAAQLKARPFQDFLIPVGVLFNGNGFYIWEPNKQYIFDSLFFSEIIEIGIIMANTDLLNGFVHSNTLIIETETL